MRGRCAVIGTVPCVADVTYANFKGNLFRWEAHAGIAHHEVHVPRNLGICCSAAKVQGLAPVHVFLKELEVQHEVGIVFLDGGALLHGSLRLYPRRPLEAKFGRDRSVVGVVVLAVDVPTRVHLGVDDKVVKALLFARVEPKVPRDGIFYLGDGVERKEKEKCGGQPMAGAPQTGLQHGNDRGAVVHVSVSRFAKIPRAEGCQIRMAPNS